MPAQISPWQGMLGSDSASAIRMGPRDSIPERIGRVAADRVLAAQTPSARHQSDGRPPGVGSVCLNQAAPPSPTAGGHATRLPRLSLLAGTCRSGTGACNQYFRTGDGAFSITVLQPTARSNGLINAVSQVGRGDESHLWLKPFQQIVTQSMVKLTSIMLIFSYPYDEVEVEMGLTVVVGADSAGVTYKEKLKADLEDDPRVDQVIDVGILAGQDVDYPHIAIRAAQIIAGGEADRGLLICGTGLGMAITANKVAGIRACVAHDSFSVERLVKSNNAQILTLGERVIGLELARLLVRQWLDHTFDVNSPSAAKVAAIRSYES